MPAIESDSIGSGGSLTMPNSHARAQCRDEKTSEISLDSDSCRNSFSRTKSTFTFVTSSAQSSLASEVSVADSKIEFYNLPNTFGRDLREHTFSSPEAPLVDAGLRTVLEPHLRKARKNREAARRRGNHEVHGVPYPELRSEIPFLFPEDGYPLNQKLADCLGVEDLALAHFAPDESFLSPLLDRSRRLAFHQVYDSFVTSFCIPFLHSIALSKGLFHSVTSGRVCYRYQSFPHINVSQPSGSAEFPSTTVDKGKSIGSISFHIPLTSSFGTNALYTESHPGKEDWHCLRASSFGMGFIFDAARCLHFSMENTTNVTRVSLDFSVLIYCEHEAARGGERISSLCSPQVIEDGFSRQGPGFYRDALVDLGPNAMYSHGTEIVQRKSGGLIDPDHRVGMPFVG